MWGYCIFYLCSFFISYFVTVFVYFIGFFVLSPIIDMFMQISSYYLEYLIFLLSSYWLVLITNFFSADHFLAGEILSILLSVLVYFTIFCCSGTDSLFLIVYFYFYFFVNWVFCFTERMISSVEFQSQSEPEEAFLKFLLYYYLKSTYLC